VHNQVIRLRGWSLDIAEDGGASGPLSVDSGPLYQVRELRNTWAEGCETAWNEKVLFNLAPSLPVKSELLVGTSKPVTHDTQVSFEPAPCKIPNHLRNPGNIVAQNDADRVFPKPYAAFNCTRKNPKFLQGAPSNFYFF
jgi:hypothetical protein